MRTRTGLNRASTVLTAASIALLTLLPPSPLPAQDSPEVLRHLYILTFNRWGELENPGERDLAITELRQHRDIQRIIIFSYGWANDGESSYATYRKMITEITAHSPAGPPRVPAAVIAIGWDSSQTGFRKLFNNILPFPGIANALAWLPDQLLFPISFWSKSAQADRIGFGGLRTALNQIFAIYEGRSDHPDVYLMGHSFGTRILSALMVNELGGVTVGSVPFASADHVRGAVLLQPALVSGNLPVKADYPLLITQSRHDHANGFLYPVANVVLNAYGFTLFEALLQRRLFRPFGDTVGAVASVVTAPMPGRVRAPEVVGRTVLLGRRTLGEIMALPLSLAFTVVATPINYGYIQIRGLMTQPVDHMMDTLAQLPLVEIPVEGLDRLLDREIPWGQRSKGLFTIGPLHESRGRMAAPGPLGLDRATVYTPEAILNGPLPMGTFSVDASDIVSRGIYGLDLARPLAAFTLGWIDPIGSHGDYTNADVVDLMAAVSNAGQPVR